MTDPAPIQPDAKNWTWVVERACPECGFDAAAFDVADLPDTFRANADAWALVLRGADVATRPNPDKWSALEYACHVRDVNQIFAHRTRQMLEQSDPLFPDWNQDTTAVADRYFDQDPATVSEQLVAAADVAARAYESVSGAQWSRPGRRSDGSPFTVASLGRYHLHDIVHHLWDVDFDAATATVSAYDSDAAAYQANTIEIPWIVEQVITRFASELEPGSRVLEIGSGGGRDALALESKGLSVRRTDITPGFVDLLREQGHDADVIDPRHDDLSDPERPGTPYDGVWASASLLHVARHNLPGVLRRLAQVTRPGGLVHLSVKEGDGERWTTHGNVSGPRHFTYWREEPLRAVVAGAGFDVIDVSRVKGSSGDDWLDVIATRR